jgi:hypothetical protein
MGNITHIYSCFTPLSFIATPERGVRSERARSPLSFSFPLSHTGAIVLDWKKLCEREIKWVSINDYTDVNIKSP